MSELSTIPPSGYYGEDWPQYSVLTQGKGGSVSMAGWTNGNEGFQQQTFLGASIRNFNIQAGFGDSTTTLSVQLVNDEYNKSDRSGFGGGDDPYHNGSFDRFQPPVVGAPVFFKFGKNFASVEQAWLKTYNDIYGNGLPLSQVFPTYTVQGEIESVPDKNYLFAYSGEGEDRVNYFVDKSILNNQSYDYRGLDHFVFGGILQGYTQNRSSAGSPLYSVTVSDPREILSNVTLILNNYAGTTHNNKNLLNIYGLLEYDPTEDLKEQIEEASIGKSEFRRENGVFTGNDTYIFNSPSSFNAGGIESIPPTFPITGQGYSRRCDQGIPWFRVYQGIRTVLNYDGSMPQEYIDKGFGGAIDFRGYKYVVDLSGLPLDKIPQMYFLQYDQIDLLSLIKEVTEAVSHDYFVSLLPILNLPPTSWVYNFNKQKILNGENNQIITGIIRIDTIDKTTQPQYGSIKSYLDDLAAAGVSVESEDVGYEVSNITTDKFIAGAQQVNMYCFATNKDRDNRAFIRRNDVIDRKFEDPQSVYQRLQSDQWSFDTALKQQVLPFYGFLGKDSVTIPRGWGPYQQIMLDTSSLNAINVGNYYVTTEMELRAASISYERWSQFLKKYNDRYCETIDGGVDENNTFYLTSLDGGHAMETAIIDLGFSGENKDGAARLFERYGGNVRLAVVVPRSVFDSESDGMAEDGLPASPCNPPYGYPLYYKRAEKIGIEGKGNIEIINNFRQIETNLQAIDTEIKNDPQLKFHYKSEKLGARDNVKLLIHELNIEIAQRCNGNKECMDIEIAARDKAIASMEATQEAYDNLKSNINTYRNFLDKNRPNYAIANKNLKKGLKNSYKVYNFLKKIADEHLGKSFLVKIPKRANMNYQLNLTPKQGIVGDDLPEILSDKLSYINGGPFGFPPLDNDNIVINSGNNTTNLPYLDDEDVEKLEQETFHHYLSLTQEEDFLYSEGALRTSYNPISLQWEFNYLPEPQGGFFDWNLSNSYVGVDTDLLLHPQDPTNLMNNNRIGAYVRFDHSEFLDLSRIGADNVIQETQTNKGRVQDLIEDIDNLGEDETWKQTNFQAVEDFIAKKFKKASVAYVKCQMDDRFYMAPKISKIYKMQITAVEGGDFNGGKVTFSNGAVGTIISIDEAGPFGNPEYRFQLLSGDLPTDDDNVTQGRVRGAVQSISNLGTRVYGESVRLIETPPEELTLFRKNQDGKFEKVTATYPAPYELFVPGRYSQLERQNKLGRYDTKREPGTKEEKQKPSEADFAGGFDNRFVEIEDFLRRRNPITSTMEIETESELLDSDHVYAIVTLPGAAIPTQDLRYIDGPNNSKNAEVISRIWARDTVKGVESLNTPPAETKGVTDKKVKVYQGRAFNKDQYALANSELLVDFVSPSPVYPNLVVLPLVSNERCYGPWLSASSLSSFDRTRYSDIGGKIEFIKDENLSPWSFGSYEALNQAGLMQAEFSNSLLLFSEKGSFTVPNAPAGLNIAKEIKKGGPVITSIQVSIADSIQTTVTMDLYSSNFGQLQKQKEDQLARLVRERQKQIDQNNEMIRKGIRKNSSFTGLSTNAGVLNKSTALAISSEKLFEQSKRFGLETGETVYNNFVFSSNPEIRHVIVEKEDDPNKTELIKQKRYYSSSALETDVYLMNAQQEAENPNEFNKLRQKTAVSNINELIVGYDESIYNHFMSNKEYRNLGSINRRMG